MNPESLLATVQDSLDALVEAGAGHEGLFPSMLDPVTNNMLVEAPDPIPGQRAGDRSYRGSNLMHDEATLLTMRALAAGRDRSDYASAVDAYLRRFATHCTSTESGLFPWGEHAYWDLETDAIGDSHRHRDPTRQSGATHDHLRAVPAWLWEALRDANPGCVDAFAEGLDFHWTEGVPREYIRHAPIERRAHHPRGTRSCDFPRHGGFYIFDWAVAWQHSGRDDFVDQIRTMADYWWSRRDERDLLLIESRTPADDERFHNINAPGQTLSLAVSLLETAPILEASCADLAATLRHRARTYVDGFFRAPHDPAAAVFVILSKRSTNEVFQTMPVWGSVYGVWPVSYVALTAIQAYRLGGDGRLLDWARGAGECYAHEPIPGGVQAPAMDAGLGLGLLADLYDVTGEAVWLERALEMAARLLPAYYRGGRLPCGAAGIDWYESQMGPGFLLHGMARTALLALDGSACPLEADYTAR
jgi:hypothetical protein